MAHRQVPGEALVDLLGGGTDATVIAEKQSRFGAERFGLRPVGSRDDDLGRRPGRKLRFPETVIVEPSALRVGENLIGRSRPVGVVLRELTKGGTDATCALRRRHAEHDVSNS